VNKLAKYLKHHSITQRGFAKKIGTTPNNLGLLVHGKSTPSLRLAYLIEKATGGLVTLYDWIEDDESTNNEKNTL
jgi:transcriptional regulator with XRE-family HTH domain